MRVPRIVLLCLPSVVVGVFLFKEAQIEWKFHRLCSDARSGIAEVTATTEVRNDFNSRREWPRTRRGWPRLSYTYQVNGQTYDGSDLTPGFPVPPVGQKITVYYSASHPWLSVLEKRNCSVLLSVLTILGLLLLGLVATLGIAHSGRGRRRFPVDEVPPPGLSN